VDEAYKDGSGSEHGIYQAYKLALYPYALEKISGTYNYREEENLFRSQGPDGGFHTGYNQIGTYTGTQENAETTSIVMITISTSPCILLFCSIPPWILYLYTGLAVCSGRSSRRSSRLGTEETRTNSSQNSRIEQLSSFSNG
jgi:hypothetical protein